MTHNELTQGIIGAAIRVHRTLGPGLLESGYEACLEYELQQLGLPVERQKPVPVVYGSVKLECGYRADLVVQGMVAVECKAKEALHPVDDAQLLSHLRLLDLRVGLLINFHVVVLKDGIKRLVNNYRGMNVRAVGREENRGGAEERGEELRSIFSSSAFLRVSAVSLLENQKEPAAFTA